MKKFTQQELDAIIFDYQNGMRPFELSKKYNRSASSIINKLKSLNIFVNSNNRYNAEDIKIISNYYICDDWKSIFEKYPNSTKSSIISLMSKNNISHSSRWNDCDKLIIKKYYYTKTIDEISKLLSKPRTKEAIETYAVKHFGYYKNNRWTEDELSILQNNYSVLPMEEIIKLIPNRTLNAIQLKAKQLGIQSLYTTKTYWNESDANFLINNWNDMSDVEIGEKLNKSPMSVKDKRHLFSLFRQDKNNPLTYQETTKFLRGQLAEWKNASMKSCNYQCVVTGSKLFHIHHIINMTEIVNVFFDTHPEYNKNYSDNSIDDLHLIANDIIEFHNQYPLGLCLRKDLHVLFHSIYGKHNNSQRQIDEFIEKYKKGELNIA